ncbi:MAG: HU family DNA-binding protein [Bacteroidales bacterium]|nr:HU family DNA-binding protein [Bacteroidales bacterium]
MAVKYKKVKQVVKDKNGNEKEVFYARSCERRKIRLNDIAERIARYTTLTRGEVHSVLMALADTIPDYLLDNESVELGDLGILSLHLGSHCEEKEEDVSWRSIKDLKVQFRAGKRIKDRLKYANFKLVK